MFSRRNIIKLIRINRATEKANIRAFAKKFDELCASDLCNTEFNQILALVIDETTGIVKVWTYEFCFSWLLEGKRRADTPPPEDGSPADAQAESEVSTETPVVLRAMLDTLLKTTLEERGFFYESSKAPVDLGKKKRGRPSKKVSVASSKKVYPVDTIFCTRIGCETPAVPVDSHSEQVICLCPNCGSLEFLSL